MVETKIGKLKVLFLAVLAVIFVMMCAPGHGHATAGINQQISFEGKIVTASGVNVPDGTYNLEFKIYQDGTGCVAGGTSPCGGTLKWTEDRLVSASQGVTVTAGTFQVNLGAINTALGTNVDWNQNTLWLSMNVGGTGTTASWDGEMTPFIRLTSVPYALNAGTVGGLSASQLVQLTPGTQQTGSISVNGNATVGSLTVGSTSVVNSSAVVQSAAVSGSYTGITGLGTVTVGTWNASTLNAAYGGTGQSGYTIGDVLYASGATALSKLSDVATGSCLISGGVGVAPTWGSCGSAGANTALSNLVSTAVNTSIIPGSAYNNLIDLGSASYGFRTAYFGTSVLAPTIDALTAGGTLNIGTTSATTLNLGIVGSTATAGVVNVATSTGAAQDVNIGGTGASGGSNSATTLSAQGGATNLFIQNSGAGIQTYTNSTTAFQIQNSAGAPVLSVDTTSTAADGTTVNYLKYPGFETGSFSNAAAGWAASSPATLTQNTNKAQTYNGLYSAQVVTTASNGGLTTSSFISAPAGGNYLVSFFAKVSSGTMASTAFSVATVGGTGSCVGASGVTINTTGFQRVYCQLTATGTVTALTITQNDSTARTIYIDAVQMQSTTFNGNTITQPTPYQIGAIQLRGVITNPVALINNGNSTAAFQIQNAGGNSNLFIADTLNNRIGIGTNAPSALLSVGASSQFQVDGSGNILASGSYNGNALTASALTFSASSTATIQSASGQTLALNTGTAAGTITTNAGTIQRTTSGGSTTTLDLNDTGTTTFKLFNSGTGVANLWLYGGGLYTGSGQLLRMDNAGNLSNIGTISSVGAATINGQLTIGVGATGESTPKLLVLDSGNTTTEPTEVDGGMYYNSALASFRCGQNGAWTDCGINAIDHTFVMQDEFLGGNTVAAGATSINNVGQLGWNVSANVSCAVAYNQAGPTLTHDHPGSLRLTATNVSGDGCTMTQGGTAAGAPTLSDIVATGDVIKTTVAGGTATGVMRVGIDNATNNTAPTSGAWVEYNNPANTTNWRYCYANNAAATCTATTDTFTANQWVRVEIRFISATAITFMITPSGGATETHALTGITYDSGATNKLGPMYSCFASTTTAQNCYMDYFQWRGVVSTTGGR